MESWYDSFLKALFNVTGDNGECTTHVYFKKHFSYPHDLPKNEQKINKRHSIFVSN